MNKLIRAHRHDAIALGAYVLATLGFFWKLAFLPNTWVPKGGGDLSSFLYPVYGFAAEQLRQGVIPLWNPYLYSGSPFAADIQSGLFYPINVLAFLAFPFSYATLEWLAVVHYFLAAAFTYLYLRGLALNPLAAFGGGLVFAFSGFTVAHLGHLNMLEAAVWLPFILYWFHRALARGSIRSALVAGLAYGISILAGHTQMSLYLAAFLVVYWIGSLIIWPGLNIRRFGILATAFMVAFGVAAVQILPSYELTQLSIRSEITYAQASEFAASPIGMITLLVPAFFGGDNFAHWGLQGSLGEVYGYVGLLPLILGLAALVVPSRGSRWRWFFAAAGLLFFLLTLGQSTVLHGWLYKFVPGFDKVRAAGRFLLLVDFAAAVLAAYGLSGLAGSVSWRERPRYRLLLIGLGLTVLISVPIVAMFYRTLLASQDKDPIIFERAQMAVNGLALALLTLALSFGLLIARRYSRRRNLIPILAIALIIFDLFSANSDFNPTDQDVTKAYEHTEVLAFFDQDESLYRIDSVTGIWDVWPPNISLRAELGDVMGIFNPMMLAEYDHYWQSLGSRSAPAYDLLNAKYVVAKKDVVLDWTKFVPVLTDAPEVNVYENQRALPRAVLVPKAEQIERDAQLERLRADDFDPRQTLLLEGQPEIPIDVQQQPLEGQVESIDLATPNEYMIQVRSNRPAYLLLSDVMYPGWQAMIDGQPTPIYRANYLFKAIVVPAGEHEVHFVFRPPIWTIGAAISLLTLLGIVSVGAWTAIRTWAAKPKERHLRPVPSLE